MALSEEEEILINQITTASAMFDQLCQVRHDDGREEYGPLTFLENDVIRMLCEELADTANYARMQFVKLMLLSDELRQFLPEHPITEQMGNQAFKGAGDAWKK